MFRVRKRERTKNTNQNHRARIVKIHDREWGITDVPRIWATLSVLFVIVLLERIVNVHRRVFNLDKHILILIAFGAECIGGEGALIENMISSSFSRTPDFRQIVASFENIFLGACPAHTCNIGMRLADFLFSPLVAVTPKNFETAKLTFWVRCACPTEFENERQECVFLLLSMKIGRVTL